VPFLSIIGLLAYITLKMVNLIHNILQKTPKKRTLSANYVEREGKYYLLACDISGEETNEDRYIQRTRRKGEVRICEFLMAALNILKGKPETQEGRPN